MVLTREAVEQSIYYEYGSLYYVCRESYCYNPPDIIPDKMKDMGYTFTDSILYVYNQFDVVCQRWFEVKRSRSKRYILW